jgi:hypothetical protein
MTQNCSVVNWIIYVFAEVTLWWFASELKSISFNEHRSVWNFAGALEYLKTLIKDKMENASSKLFFFWRTLVTYFQYIAHDGTLSFRNFMLMVDFLISILRLYAPWAYTVMI